MKDILESRASFLNSQPKLNRLICSDAQIPIYFFQRSIKPSLPPTFSNCYSLITNTEVIMLPNKLPKEKLKVIIPLTRHSIESPEISPLESPVKSEATASSDSTVKDRDDDIGSGGTERDGTKRDSAEGDSTEGDRNEMDNTTSFAHLSVSYVDNADTESFARLSVSYANMDRIETIQQSIVIEHWNCHAVSIVAPFRFKPILRVISKMEYLYLLTYQYAVLQNQWNGRRKPANLGGCWGRILHKPGLQA
jgi:hypothetical protein